MVADVPHQWLDNLEIFKKYFIGRTAYADECVIENEEVLDFEWKPGSILKASAAAPLIIKNSALGYDIRCILAGFKLVIVSNSVYIFVKTC